MSDHSYHGFDAKAHQETLQTLGQGVKHVTVQPDEAGQRIDNYLIRILDNRVPKSLVYRVLRKGDVRINKKRAKPTQKIGVGDIVRVPPIHIPEAHEAPVISPKLLSAVENWVVYEDEDVLVVDKPAGLAVHSGSGVDYGVIDVLRAERHAGEYLELAHRLDRDTSGVLVFGKNADTLRGLQRAMQASESRKLYELWVHGDWKPRQKDVTTPLKRIQRGNERIVEVATLDEVELGEAKTAETIFEKLATERLHDGNLVITKLSAELLTGRTHQIRVHAASEKHPIINDSKYGHAKLDALIDNTSMKNNLQLRAVELNLSHWKPHYHWKIAGL